MTNDPASIAAALRTFSIYAVCCVLAIIMGVLMTNPMTYSSLGFVAVVCAVMCIPILLRWHHPLMIFCWNAPFMAFFVKGDPKFTLVLVAISLAISTCERALNQRRFINVPEVTWPLLALTVVVLITAKMTGGIGLHAFGSDVYGGKKYVFLIVGILSYFALVAHRIPPEKARRYVTLYFVGGTLGFIGDLAMVAPGFLHPIFWFIPPVVAYAPGNFDLGSTRLVGTSWAASTLISTLIARYGIRGIFMGGKIWRPAVLFLCLILVCLGGFRSALIAFGLIFTLQFFLEGMQRTRLMPFFILIMLAVAAAVIPLASKLPFTFQRTLAFLPEGMVHLSTDARLAAQDSTQWRLDMWQALLPQVPKYLLLGKGYAITTEDFASIGADSAIHNSADAADQSLALSSDYHSGPLSVIIPFGIWGAMVFLWFIYVSVRIMYRNFRYSDPALKLINSFLFTSYVVGVFNFFFIQGALADGLLGFCGTLGLSISVNNGVCRAPVRPLKNIPFKRPMTHAHLRPQPAFQRGITGAPSV